MTLLLQQLGTAQTSDPVMTAASWAFMLGAWAFVIGLVVFCFKRVLGGGPKG